jgi:hypothetical protein
VVVAVALEVRLASRVVLVVVVVTLAVAQVLEYLVKVLDLQELELLTAHPAS